jgi:hypothetical protein
MLTVPAQAFASGLERHLDRTRSPFEIVAPTGTPGRKMKTASGFATGGGSSVREVMKAITVLFAAVVVAACTHGGRPETDARLTAALSGRTAGPAQDCVSERGLESEPYGGRVILFRGPTDDVVYVNRPEAGCPGLDSGRAIRIRTPAARLCRGDIATVFDPMSGTELGGCSLGEFTPYRRDLPPKTK